MPDTLLNVKDKVMIMVDTVLRLIIVRVYWGR